MSLSSIIAGAFYGIYSLFILALGFSGSTSFIGLIKLKTLKEIYLSGGRSLYRMELEKIDLNQKKIGLFSSIMWIFYSLASMISSIVGIIYRRVVIVDSTMSSLDPSNTTTLTSSTLTTIRIIKSDYIPTIIITSLAIIIYLYVGVYLFGLSKVKHSLAIRQGSICSFMFTSMCIVPLISTIYVELNHDRRIGEFVCILMLGFTYSIYAERIMYLSIGRSFSFKRFRSFI
nr:736_t:CDS:2 [Entrophospora candida]